MRFSPSVVTSHISRITIFIPMSSTSFSKTFFFIFSIRISFHPNLKEIGGRVIQAIFSKSACGQACWPAVRHGIWTLTFFSCPSFRRAFVLSTRPPIRLDTKQKIRAHVKPEFAGDHYKRGRKPRFPSLYPSFLVEILPFLSRGFTFLRF